ncbi:MAG: tetrahydromethanopterin S-methyltransferase subunit H [Candidatus Thorarchaeota archaeon]|nr:MAG: tetrahydromethanopterin S-methyltransferase subunit H [Candidatus Thorarchaeota archaeon]
MKFEREQSVLKVGDVEIGGQLGELPTVLVGSIFFDGHKIVDKDNEEAFDKKKARSLIETQEELSNKTNVPHMVDIVGSTASSIKKRIDFVADVTEAPIFVDSTLPDVRVEGYRHAAEIGLIERVVYNSITDHSKDDEISSLRDLGAKHAVLLAYHASAVWPYGRVDLLRGSEAKRGLLEVASEAGIGNLMVDTAVLDVPSIGLAAEAVRLVKEELGLVAGGGPSNAVLEWDRVGELGKRAKNVCIAAATSAMQHSGADFLLYGPIGLAKVVFPSVAMTDAIIAYKARQYGIRPKSKMHPLYTIF